MEEVNLWGWLPWWLHPDVVTPVSTLVTMFATFVIAAATVFNVLVSRRMATAAKESADAARRSAETAGRAASVTEAIFEAAHRPYFGVSGFRAHPYPTGKIIELQIRVKNFGTVPLDCFFRKIEVDVAGENQPAQTIGEGGVMLPGGDAVLLHSFQGPKHTI